MGMVQNLLKNEKFKKLPPRQRRLAFRVALNEDPKFKNLPLDQLNLAEDELVRDTGPSLGSRVGKAAHTAVRVSDVPRQAVLAHAGGFPMKRALEQIDDPSKVITGQEVIEKQFPVTEETGFFGAAGRAALGTALEFADPLILPAAAKSAVNLGRRAVGGAKKTFGKIFGKTPPIKLTEEMVVRQTPEGQ
ncbi:hypothetical protein LCGC14_2455840, partial [marine sediment metagenome]